MTGKELRLNNEMSVFIEISDLCKIYKQGPNEVRALQDITLNIEENEFITLMGPSGSGKTTLLNIIAGIDKQTSGTVKINGAEVSKLPEKELTAWRTRGIGYIFQFYNLIPVLTAYENIELPLLKLSMSKKERHDHVTAALEAVSVIEFKEHLPRELSGGQEQRVAIARALVTDTPLLIADEPTGNLDADTEKEIMKLLKALHTEHKKTIVMVTHDETAAVFADRTVKLHKGRIVDHGGRN
ncbi:ABC transporter ATP-binding protein [Verrucomicrobiota bacterium]